MNKFPYFCVLFAILLALSLVVDPVFAFQKDVTDSPVGLVKTEVPSLADLNLAINIGDHFIGNLYKPIDSENSTISEYFGLPINVYFDGYKKWDLLGENKNAFCKFLNLVGCTKTTHINKILQDENL